MQQQSCKFKWEALIQENVEKDLKIQEIKEFYNKQSERYNSKIVDYE